MIIPSVSESCGWNREIGEPDHVVDTQAAQKACRLRSRVRRIHDQALKEQHQPEVSRCAMDVSLAKVLCGDIDEHGACITI